MLNQDELEEALQTTGLFASSFGKWAENWIARRNGQSRIPSGLKFQEDMGKLRDVIQMACSRYTNSGALSLSQPEKSRISSFERVVLKSKNNTFQIQFDYSVKSKSAIVIKTRTTYSNPWNRRRPFVLYRNFDSGQLSQIQAQISEFLQIRVHDFLQLQEKHAAEYALLKPNSGNKKRASNVAYNNGGFSGLFPLFQ